MGVGRKHNTQKQHTRRAGETVAAKGAETGFLESLANLGVLGCAREKSLNHHATQSQRSQRRGSRGSSNSHRRGRAWAGTVLTPKPNKRLTDRRSHVHLHTVPPLTCTCWRDAGALAQKHRVTPWPWPACPTATPDETPARVRSRPIRSRKGVRAGPAQPSGKIQKLSSNAPTRKEKTAVTSVTLTAGTQPPRSTLDGRFSKHGGRGLKRSMKTRQQLPSTAAIPTSRIIPPEPISCFLTPLSQCASGLVL